MRGSLAKLDAYRYVFCTVISIYYIIKMEQCHFLKREDAAS